MLEVINEFSKFSGYKINIWKKIECSNTLKIKCSNTLKIDK